MMKNFWGMIWVVLFLAVICFLAFSYQVRQTEKVLVTRFGEHVRTEEEPGLKWRLPIPIERVHRFDKRVRLFEVQMSETATAGGEPIIIVSYLTWRVGDPLLFLNSVQDEAGAKQMLRSLLQDRQNSVVGRHYFSEFVNTDPEKIHYEEIEQEVSNDIRPVAAASYGIEVVSVGIKRLMVPESSTQEVFERMKADRKGKTEAIIADGESPAKRIRSDAEAKQKELLAVAESQAQTIRGEGDAQAAQYYKDLEADPELAMFLRDLEALRKILKDRTTIILGTDIEPIQLLKDMPDLKPESK